MNNCKICSNLKSLDEHLNDLAAFCIFLANKNQYHYQHKDKPVDISTDRIGEWLKLAADLKSIEISPGGFSSDLDCWCEPRMDALDEDAETYSHLSKALTKYIFSYQALENAQKFIYSFGNDLELRDASVRCENLISSLTIDKLPENFEHHTLNLRKQYERYIKIYSSPFNNILNLPKDDIAYCHCILRNLRNIISHGGFPLNYGIDPMDIESAVILIKLLNSAIRMVCIYIQIIIISFCDGIKSPQYYEMYEHCIEESSEEKSMYFLEKFNINLAKNLHYNSQYNISDFFF